jgi:hypothetical protein
MTEEAVQPTGRPMDLARLIALARWQEAEARLYPVVMSDPDKYKATVQVIAAVTAHLRERYHSSEELFGVPDAELYGVVGAEPRLAELVTGAGLALNLVTDAARVHAIRTRPDAP